MPARKTTRRRKTSTPRKRSTTRRRRPSAPVRRRRRRTTRKKGFLSEVMKPAEAKAGAMVTVNGAIGGVGAYILQEKILKDKQRTEVETALWTLGVAFGISTILKMPEVGTGMAGVAGYQLIKEQKQLGEMLGLGQGPLKNTVYADPDAMQKFPAMLSQGNYGLYEGEIGMYENSDMGMYG